MTDHALLSYCPDLYHYARRETREVTVGKVGIGGSNPIRVQSMLTSDTRDVAECIKQTLELVAVGCEIVRITAQTRPIAENLEHIKAGLLAQGCDVPLVADIHFKPDAAMEAAKWVEKVRVNPGNYVDKKKFAVREYTDDEYAEEVAAIEEAFVPLVELCKEKHRAMRIGTNHGSLSDRIMNRYGDTPLGMVESALEFARIARRHDYHNFLFSMKASNPKVMIEAYRLLVARLYHEGADWNYPIHLGVTEAGDGEDGRIKSAIGIGSLLHDGIGDTIRVSLTEDAVYEIPVAHKLVAPFARGYDPVSPAKKPAPAWDPFSYRRRASELISYNGTTIGSADQVAKVVISPEDHERIKHKLAQMGDYQPDCIFDPGSILEIDPENDDDVAKAHALDLPHLITVRDNIRLDHPVVAFRLLAARVHERHPILLKDSLKAPTAAEPQRDFEAYLTDTAKNLGSLICDGIGDAVYLRGWDGPGQLMRVAFNVLQAAGARIFKTDYVACPSCGRTLFNLQTTTQKIRAATGHLKGVRIAVMGCIVNGPGEMADADFGYVGGAPNKINLYVGKTAVKFNIPEDEAVERLIDLIKEHNRWIEAPEPVSEVVA
jgi:(E)-4-hydroxy-3-methylbut-2-enyl-diphosphate synthase